MVKYIVNCKVHGYEGLDLQQEAVKDIKDALVIVVITNDYECESFEVYKATETLIDNNNRVILISTNADNSIFKVLASLLILKKCYDIYTVKDKEDVNGNYLLHVEDREASIVEVQNYISSELITYDDIVNILFGIESLVKDGEVDKLISFIDSKTLSIETLTSTINSMKKKCEMVNTNELVEEVNKAIEAKKEAESKLDSLTSELKETKFDRDSFKVKFEDAEKEAKKLREKNSELEKDAGSSVSVIKSYRETNIQLLNCKTKIVLYFKELSYVPYTNTLVMQLMNVLDAWKLKSKLLIYDSNTNLYNSYKPLPIIFGKDYINMRDTLIDKTKIFVVAEPNPAVITDILISEKAFDVVIVYDRMRENTDIVSGNNVTKFYIINSSVDYRELAPILKIPDTSNIITHAHSTITDYKTHEQKFLDIPFITGFNTLTDSAKTNKYLKAVTQLTKEHLVTTIFKKARIDTLK